MGWVGLQKLDPCPCLSSEYTALMLITFCLRSIDIIFSVSLWSPVSGGFLPWCSYWPIVIVCILTYCHIVCLQIVLYEMLFCIRLQWHGLQFSAKYQLCDLCNAICRSNCPPCTPLYEAVLSRFCFHSCASTIHEFILLYWDSNSVRHNARWDCVKTIMLYDEFLSPSDHAVIVVFSEQTDNRTGSWTVCNAVNDQIVHNNLRSSICRLRLRALVACSQATVSIAVP